MLKMQRYCDVDDPRSIANRLRNRRFAVFADLVDRLDGVVRIIDIGGTVGFWQMRGWANRPDVAITLVNLECEPTDGTRITSTAGDATDLRSFDDHAFDVAFSNSVIEHLFTLEAQRAMAQEIQRVARAHWIQTPNLWFPMEPHFHVPGWQWLPREWRIRLLQRRRCGWRGPCADRCDAEALVDEVRLMSRSELRAVFPHSEIRAERVAGLVKSWIVLAGFPARTS